MNFPLSYNRSFAKYKVNNFCLILQEAAKTIAFLRRLDVNDKTIQSEIEFMKNEEATYDSLPKISFKSICE